MSFTKTQLTKAANNNLRKAILTALSVSATLVYSSQAAAISPPSLGSIASGATATVTGNAPKRAWSDYGTNENYGWTHTAGFRIFQIGNAADLLAETRFDVTVDLKQNGGATPMNFPGFSIWSSGATALVTGAANGSGYGHHWSQVRGPKDGGIAGDPCGNGGDCALGSNGWLGTGGGGNLIDGHNGWIGYANAGYSFTNKDGDKIQGLLAGATNASNVGQYGTGLSIPALDGTTLNNVNGSSPYVNGGSATLSAGDAFLTLSGLKAGYYLIGYAGSCPDDNANGQGCSTPGGQAFRLDISNTGVSAVPLPGAVWLFGSAIAGITAFGRRKLASV
jgi:hypothetical protein